MLRQKEDLKGTNKRKGEGNSLTVKPRRFGEIDGKRNRRRAKTTGRESETLQSTLQNTKFMCVSTNPVSFLFSYLNDSGAY